MKDFWLWRFFGEEEDEILRERVGVMVGVSCV